MAIDRDTLRFVIKRLILDGENHRRLMFEGLNRQFLAYALEFFEQIAMAKPASGNRDWYRDIFIQHGIDKEELSVRGAVPEKTVGNIHGSQRYDLVLAEAQRNVDYLRRTMAALLDGETPDGHFLAIDTGGDLVELTLEETLLVVSALAVKYGKLRGGTWSSLGKQAEIPLMETLCELFGVAHRHRRAPGVGEGHHQTDYTLIKDAMVYRCEVKLSGKGNPEGLPLAPARGARLLVADQMSDQTKQTCVEMNVQWVELAAPEGWKRFGQVLDAFKIPHVERETVSSSELDATLERVLP